MTAGSPPTRPCVAPAVDNSPSKSPETPSPQSKWARLRQARQSLASDLQRSKSKQLCDEFTRSSSSIFHSPDASDNPCLKPEATAVSNCSERVFQSVISESPNGHSVALKIVKADGLPSVAKHGAAQKPLVVVKAKTGQQLFKSEIGKSSTNPAWNADVTLHGLDISQLEFIILHKKLLGTRLIGTATLDVLSAREKRSLNLPITTADGKRTDGTLTVSFELSYAGKPEQHVESNSGGFNDRLKCAGKLAGGVGKLAIKSALNPVSTISSSLTAISTIASLKKAATKRVDAPKYFLPFWISSLLPYMPAEASRILAGDPAGNLTVGVERAVCPFFTLKSFQSLSANHSV